MPDCITSDKTDKTNDKNTFDNDILSTIFDNASKPTTLPINSNQVSSTITVTNDNIKRTMKFLHIPSYIQNMLTNSHGKLSKKSQTTKYMEKLTY